MKTVTTIVNSQLDNSDSTNLDGVDSEQSRKLLQPVGDVPNSDGTVMGRPLPVPIVYELAGSDREAIPAIGVANFENRASNRFGFGDEKFQAGIGCFNHR